MSTKVKSATERPASADYADLLRSNEELRNELRVLRDAHTELTRRFTDAAQHTQAERASRRAALNLMEDAVAARRAEQSELAERRRIEEELRVADRRKDEFLATLAHELRNPLAPIRNGLLILKLCGLPTDAAQSAHAMVDRQVGHLIRLVDDLLEVSRISRGMIELRRELVDVGSIIRTAVETSRPLIESSKHTLAVDVRSTAGAMFGDPVRLSQIVTNLLNNAAKYTRSGGSIHVAAEESAANAVRISVSDTGIGIPPEMMPKVFDLFTQVDPIVTRSYGGLGIGLTLARKLVELHGGTIEGKSEGLGKGTEFIICLPRDRRRVART